MQDVFVTALDTRKGIIEAQLPSYIGWDRFRATAISAVRQTPAILEATTSSIFSALTKAAQDGLMPDGREGVITVYSGKNGKEAVWNPMLYGLRKRARELDNVIIDAQAVYSGDTFVWHQGDEPKIVHTPAPLGGERGQLIGAYAIFRDKDGVVLHREVMGRDQIEATRGQSRAKDSLMWTTFKEEAYRKTVVRRGVKTVPVGAQLDQIVRRDDEAFAFSDRPQPVEGNGNAKIEQHEARPALAGPPKAPAPPPKQTGNGGGQQPAGVDQRAAEGNAATERGLGQDASIEDAQVVPDDAGGELSADPAGDGAPAETANDAAGPARSVVPPGVGADGRVGDLAAFSTWIAGALRLADDPSQVWEIWETQVDPWRERMTAAQWSAVKPLQKLALDDLMSIPKELQR